MNSASDIDNPLFPCSSFPIPFSGTYDVQHCDVHTDHTSCILVECTFAIDSTAPGFVLIQDEHSQYTISTTLQRHEDDVSKGSVLILGVPAGEYNVTVYDEMPSIHKKPAYMYVYRHKISSTLSTRFTGTIKMTTIVPNSFLSFLPSATSQTHALQLVLICMMFSEAQK